MSLYQDKINVSEPAVAPKNFFTTIKNRMVNLFKPKFLTLHTAIPVIIEEQIEIKSLQNSKIYFWDYENSPNFDPRYIEGHLFIIANINISMLEKIQEMRLTLKKIKFHVYDTSHSQKNYADIIIGTIIGEIFQGCRSLKEVNLISKDKGFESIQHFLRTQGIRNVNIIKAQQQIVVDKKYDQFFEEVNRRFVDRSVNLRKVRRLGETFGLNEEETLHLLNQTYDCAYNQQEKQIIIKTKQQLC